MRLLYVDDEKPALENFKFTVSGFEDVESVKLLTNGAEAIEFIKTNPVDIAFLDMEMPGIHGLDLASKLKEINKNIRIIYVTAYGQYALEAFGVGAIGYVMKPYTKQDIRNEIEKITTLTQRPVHNIKFQTIPNFNLYINGRYIRLTRTKTTELLALLVDRGERGITSGEGISVLWPDRDNDSNTQALFRMTYKRLLDTMDAQGIAHIVSTKGNIRYMHTDMIDCDLYDILAGDKEAAKLYTGEYLSEYSWAEDRNAQLYHMLFSKLI